MKIYLSRSGGFTGIPMQAELDTDHMDPEEARKIENALSQASFFQLPENLQDERRGPDRFTYYLTVENDAVQHSVRMPKSTIPEPLQPLLPELMSRYRGQRLGQ